MPFRRQRDGDICPLYQEQIRSSGGKYTPHALPCLSKAKFGDGKCEYHSQSWSGRYMTTVQCRLKDEEAARVKHKKR